MHPHIGRIADNLFKCYPFFFQSVARKRRVTRRRRDMRRVDQDWQGSPVRVALRNAWRRVDWFTNGVSRQQRVNGAIAAMGYGLKLQRLRSWPVLVKVDISPICNLRCTYCVHGDPAVEKTGSLAEQSFTSGQRMSLPQFEALLAQISNRSAAVALYYVGDPFMHPDLARFCAATARAGLNCHVSTNFSFHLSDARLTAIVESGLTHLTVCVDSMLQNRYELTRIGGKVELVLNNLKRTLAIRNGLGLKKPNVEVQFIKYRHNIDEINDSADWCEANGVDQFTEYWGNLYNYADVDPKNYHTGDALDGQLFPRCAWPWFALQIKYNGDVLPCCYHRVSEQYRIGGDARTVGNVFGSDVFEIWNSPAYQRMRRLSSNPVGAEKQDNVVDSFCYGCPSVFNTTAADRKITADKAGWEDVYAKTASGEIVRR
jgi:MoaA/NifB/PqqE/SkfB family radical SAM enzyme